MTEPTGDELRGGPAGYSAALTELEEILGELEGDTVDIDRLADQVRRRGAHPHLPRPHRRRADRDRAGRRRARRGHRDRWS